MFTHLEPAVVQGSFESSGLQELLLTFLSLRLDPAGQLLAVELHVGTLAPPLCRTSWLLSFL